MVRDAHQRLVLKHTLPGSPSAAWDTAAPRTEPRDGWAICIGGQEPPAGYVSVPFEGYSSKFLRSSLFALQLPMWLVRSSPEAVARNQLNPRRDRLAIEKDCFDRTSAHLGCEFCAWQDGLHNVIGSFPMAV